MIRRDTRTQGEAYADALERSAAQLVHNQRMTTNCERAFAKRPEVYAAWVQLNGAIKAGMDLRRYELATFAAAKTVDALGVRPDAGYPELEPELREALVVGRPIADV